MIEDGGSNREPPSSLFHAPASLTSRWSFRLSVLPSSLVFRLLLSRDLVEEPTLGGGEAVHALLADLVQHAVDLCGHGIGLRAAARAQRGGRGPALGLGGPD